MRKFISLLLSAVMIMSVFSVLSVTASAEEIADTDISTEENVGGSDITDGDELPEGDDITDGDGTGEEDEEELPEGGEEENAVTMEFIPADETEYHTYRYSNGGWIWSEENLFEYYYWSLESVYGEGNKLVFTDSEGNTDVYTCSEFYDFENENGDCLDYDSLSCEIVAEYEDFCELYITYGDLSCSYPITFLESDIESIKPLNDEPIVLDAYREGFYDRLIAGKDEGEIAFFYDTTYNEDFGFVVTYEDGTERIASINEDCDLVFEDTQEEISFLDLSDASSQLYEEWLPGNVYTVTYFYQGVSFGVQFKVSENEVVSIDYVQSGEAPALVYGVDGIFSECDHIGCAESLNLYFNFDQTRVFPADGDIITVTHSDNTSEVFKWENGWLYNESGEETFNDFICLYDDQDENHWTLGENSFTIRFFGYEDIVNVNVVEREIESVDISSFEPINVYEHTNGMWAKDEDGNEIYIYESVIFTEGVYIQINYTDGSYDMFWYDESGWFVDESGRYFPFEILTSDNQFEEPWDVGEHEILVEMGSYEAIFTVEIVENPVESIDFRISETPVFKFEDEEHGFWFDFGFGEEEDSEEVFIYYFDEYQPYSDGNSIVVTFTDGTVVTYAYDEEIGDFVDVEGNLLFEGYYIFFTDRQDEINWTPGSAENYIIAEFMGARDYINVVIDNGEKPVASKVESISNTETGIELTWSKVNNAEEYLIYRRLEKADGKPSGNPWVLVGSTNELSFLDTFELKDGAYYKYHIHTVNSNGQSAYNGAVTLTGRYIAPVMNFTVTNTKSGVLFNWQRVSGYKIRLFRLEQGADEWVYLGEKNSDSANVYNATAKSGKTYMYAAAYYIDGVASAIVYSDYITYLAEPDLKTIKNAVTGIYFNWTKVEGATGYRVYRRAAGEKYFTYLGTTTNLWYCDQAVQYNNGTYYKYTVKVIAADGSMSSYEDGLLLRRLVVPYIQSLTNNTNGITVKWAEIPGATSYRIYRRGAGQTTWTYITSVTDVLSYTDTAVKNSTGNYYRYTVKAVVNGIFTDYNPDGPYTMRLSTPTLKSARQVDKGIEVKWNAVKGAQGYQVYRKTADTTWVLIDTFGGTTYVDKTALPGVEYTYTIRAYKGSYRSSYIPAGVSAHSGVAE